MREGRERRRRKATASTRLREEGETGLGMGGGGTEDGRGGGDGGGRSIQGDDAADQSCRGEDVSLFVPGRVRKHRHGDSPAARLHRPTA